MMTLRTLAISAVVGWMSAGQALHAETATGQNDLRDFRIGMTVAELPAEGYGKFACGSNGEDAAQALQSWSGFRTCSAESTGLREVRFEYTATRVEFVKANDKWEGTRVFGHPAVVSLLIDETGTVEGIRIMTDPTSRPYMRKKAFLLGQRAKYRFSPTTWECDDLAPSGGETPVGGIYIKERCENRLTDRLITLEIDLYRTADQSLKDFVNRTRIEIRPAG